MDRAAKLAAEADAFIEMERANRGRLSDKAARDATRYVLAHLAASLGFPENEISAAIDTALARR